MFHRRSTTNPGPWGVTLALFLAVAFIVAISLTGGFETEEGSRVALQVFAWDIGLFLLVFITAKLVERMRKTR